MIENPKQPSEFDAVLGGQAPYLPGSVVLGGIEGVKRRLANTSITDQIEVLSEALKYGDAGLDLVIQALQDRDRQVKQTAYNLLRQSRKQKARQAIHSWNPYQDFQRYYTWETSWLITSMSLSCDGTILVCSELDDWTFDDSGIDVLDLKTGQQICYFNTGNARFSADSIAISPNRRDIIWSTTGDKITVGDLTTGEEIRTIYPNENGSSKGIHSITVSPDGQKIICFSPKTARVLDLATGQTIYTLKAPSDSVKFIAASPDGEIIVSQSGNAIALWDLKTGQQVHSFTITLRHFQTGRELRSLKALTHPVKFVSISSNNQNLIAFNSNDTITIWDLRTGQEIHTLEWRLYSKSIVISADGQTLINYGEDKRNSGVTVWDLYTGKMLHTLTKDSVEFLILSANEQTIVYTKGRGGYGGNVVNVWKLN